jgi:hypothetical protein
MKRRKAIGKAIATRTEGVIYEKQESENKNKKVTGEARPSSRMSSLETPTPYASALSGSAQQREKQIQERQRTLLILQAQKQKTMKAAMCFWMVLLVW